jgi:DNA-binding SARP family transcriptional activator
VLQLRTLGGLSLVRDGNLFAGAAGQRGRLAILAVIAAAGDTGVSRDRIHSLFWPDSDTERARGALNQSLFAIRRDLGEREAILGNTEIRLNASVLGCDLRDFGDAVAAAELERAVGLYAGPFLDGIHVRSGEFERWVEQEREKHASRYRDALRQLIDRSRASGDISATVRWCQLLASAEPLSALSALALMKAHVANNDSASALIQARRYEALIREELGAEPDSIVTRFAETLRSTVPSVNETARRLPGNGALNGDPATVIVHHERPNAAPNAAPPDAATGRDDSASVESRAPRLRRRWLYAAVTAFVGIGYAGWRFFDTAELHGVVVTSVATLGRVSPPDPLDEIFRARLSSGIADLHLPDLVVSPAPAVAGPSVSRHVLTQKEMEKLARDAGARFVVVSAITSGDDSLLLDVTVTDMLTSRALRPIEPQRVHRRDFGVGVDRLRSRLMASLAGRADPFFASWGHAAALPTTWESLSKLREGIDVWHRHSMKGAAKQAIPHFRASAALDTMSATPLVWAAHVSDSAESHEIATRISRSHLITGAWDRAMLEMDRAADAGDLYAAHIAAHQVMNTAPNSEFGLMLAWSALVIGRANEAIEVLRTTDPSSAPLEHDAQYWAVFASAHHYIKDYAQELAVADEALRRNPNDRVFMQMKVKALSGLGRVGDVEAICKSSVRFTARDGWHLQPCDQAVAELWAHGHPDGARRLARHVLQMRSAAPDVEPSSHVEALVTMLTEIRDYKAAQAAMRAPDPTGAPGDLDERGSPYRAAYLAATRGDRTHVENYLNQLDKQPLPTKAIRKAMGSVTHAEMAALLGDRDAAVSWMARALRDGFMWRHVVHYLPAFDRVRDYPPFAALFQPVEGPEEIALKHARAVASPP